jgi:hypothetical protein
MKGTLTSGWAADWWKRLGILCPILAATAMVSPAQNEQASNNSIVFTTLFNFDHANGDGPTGVLWKLPFRLPMPTQPVWTWGIPLGAL